MASPSAPIVERFDQFDITLISPGMLSEADEFDELDAMPSAAKTASLRNADVETTLEKLINQEDSSTDRLTYGLMRMGAADDPAKRGKLSIEKRHEAYLEILKQRKVVVTFDVMEVVQQAVSNAQ